MTVSIGAGLTRDLAEQIVRSPKTVAGVVQWNPVRKLRNGDYASPWWEMVAPLSIDGQLVPGLEFRGSTNPKASPQRMDLMLRAGDIDLGRMSLRPSGSHTNNALGHQRITLPAGMPRSYNGLQDPDWPPPKGGTRLAQVILREMPDAVALIRYSMEVWRIEGDIPEPPYAPELPL